MAGTSGAAGSPVASGSSGSSGGGGASGTGAAGQNASDMAGEGGVEMGAGGSAGAAGMTPDPGVCGSRTGQRGKTSRMISVGNAQRSFIAYLPQSADPTTPVPLVYVFHGANQSGQIMFDATEYSKLADTEGIAVVFPDGQGTSSTSGATSLAPWNVSDGPGLCGIGTLVSNPNPVDFAFIDAIKVELSQDQCIDDDHVYATGFSMGGYMSHHVACDRPDFRAAAPHSGGTMASLASCATERMPIIIFHGTADPLINEACTDPEGTPEPGYQNAGALWAAKNGCQPTYQTIPKNGSGGMTGQCYLYDGCPEGGQVETCTFNGMAHAWAGAPVCVSCIGAGTGFASATAIEWEFFKTYAW
jgi:polyhydroxybutyrate depolymerase